MAKRRYFGSLAADMPYPIITPVAPCIRMIPIEPIISRMKLVVSEVWMFAVIIENGMNIEPNPRPRVRP